MPCSYTQYIETGNPAAFYRRPEYGLVLRYSSYSILEKTEGLVYPLSSFIAEVGGSLGLFIGLSFLSIYDLIIDFIYFTIGLMKK